MMTNDFQPLLKISENVELQRILSLDGLAKVSFSLITIISVGALGQSILFATLPPRVAAVPAVIVLICTLITRAIEASSPNRNPLLRTTIPGRVSAQIPDPYDGSFSSTSAERGLVVFHIGVEYNHPLGVMCPGGDDVKNHFAAMMQGLRENTDRYGFLGSTVFTGDTPSGGTTLLTVMYFRDVDGLHRFAHDPAHRAGWDFLSRFSKDGNRHIAAFHETFVVQPGNYETMYLDSEPILLGNAKVKLQNPTGGWASTLVTADIPQLRTMNSRLGLAAKR